MEQTQSVCDCEGAKRDLVTGIQLCFAASDMKIDMQIHAEQIVLLDYNLNTFNTLATHVCIYSYVEFVSVIYSLNWNDE